MVRGMWLKPAKLQQPHQRLSNNNNDKNNNNNNNNNNNTQNIYKNTTNNNNLTLLWGFRSYAASSNVGLVLFWGEGRVGHPGVWDGASSSSSLSSLPERGNSSTFFNILQQEHSSAGTFFNIIFIFNLPIKLELASCSRWLMPFVLNWQ